jgi:hypothetical protein
VEHNTIRSKPYRFICQTSTRPLRPKGAVRFVAELALSCLLAGSTWAEPQAFSEDRSPELWLTLPESSTQTAGVFRLDWGYDFQRGNRADRVFNTDQTQTGVRRNRRKTHLVDW